MLYIGYLIILDDQSIKKISFVMLTPCKIIVLSNKRIPQ